MKKTFIVIAMLLLVFAISCDGDIRNPHLTPSLKCLKIRGMHSSRLRLAYSRLYSRKMM